MPPIGTNGVGSIFFKILLSFIFSYLFGLFQIGILSSYSICLQALEKERDVKT